MDNERSRCAIVVVTGGETRGLLDTMQTINRQALAPGMAVEVIVQIDPRHSVGMEERLLPRVYPWAPPTTTLECRVSELPERVLGAGSADIFMFIRTRDQLLAHALRRLMKRHREPGWVGALGACRWTNVQGSWSHSSVDDLFGWPDRISTSRLFEPVFGDPSTIGVFHRDYLDGSTGGDPAHFAIEKGYVAARYYCGNPNFRRTYRVDSDVTGRNSVPQLRPRYPLRELETRGENGPWLFGERRGFGAEDNAWALFRHCTDRLPQIDCHFVLDPGAEAEIPHEYRSRVVYKGTPAWKALLDVAAKILFTDTAMDVFDKRSDVDRYAHVEYVYLTHGMLAYSPGIYQKYHPYFDRVVCCSGSDIEAAATEWGFPAWKFSTTGLPRWDNLQPARSARRELLFCPTWRHTLNTSMWESEELPSDIDLESFRESDYFKSISRFLSAPELHEYLEFNQLKLNVWLHFRVRPYLGIFRELETPRILVGNPGSAERCLRDVMQQSLALVTDYSSIMWDMAYMDKPVCCYQFDKPAMLAERNRTGFCLPDDELVADVCYRLEDVFASLEAMAERDFQMDGDARGRLDRLIPHRDGKNCERLTQSLLAMEQKVTTRPETEDPGDDDFEALAYPLGGTASKSLRVAVIGCSDHVTPESGETILDSSRWIEELATDGFDALRIVPFLKADDPWGARFFNAQSMRDVMDKALSTATGRGIDVEVTWPAVLPYEPGMFDLRDAEVTVLLPEAVTVTCDISVIVPVYNGEKHISRCLDSILTQRFQGKFEIIVVDDGSIDGTLDILLDYEKAHEGVRVLRQRNARQGMARNHALIHARGEYVTFVDADDALPEGALAELHIAVTHENLDVAIGVVASWTPGEFPQRVNQAYFHYSQAPSTITTATWPHVFYDPSCVGKLFRRQYLLENRLFFPQSFHEDQAFNFHLFSLNPRCAVTATVVYLYVARPDDQGVSGTQLFSVQKFEQILNVGIYAEQVVRREKLESRLHAYAVGFLLLRYDRFLWKRYQTHDPRELDPESWQRLARSLQSIVSHVDPATIVGQCRYNCMMFLCLKFGLLELAWKSLQDDSLAIEHFRQNGLVAGETLDGIESGDEWRYAYNYYRSEEITGLAGSDDIVTDASFGFRLGAILVGNLERKLSLPQKVWELFALGVDMVSGRGRRRDAERKASLEACSLDKLYRHSEAIKRSVQFRVGVTVMESVTKRRPPIWQLRNVVREIRASG